jgi:hypothetical protein
MAIRPGLPHLGERGLVVPRVAGDIEEWRIQPVAEKRMAQGLPQGGFAREAQAHGFVGGGGTGDEFGQASRVQQTSRDAAGESVSRAVETTPANEPGVSIAPAIIPNGQARFVPAAPMMPWRSKRPSKPRAEPQSFCARAIAACPPEIGTAKSPVAPNPRTDRKNLRDLETQLPLPPHAMSRPFLRQAPGSSRGHRLHRQSASRSRGIT